MTVIDQELGLRERKRRATRMAIQKAAIDLATERGVDGVTVEEIGHAANVSPRTFFNYFPTKDAAIVGEIPQLPDDESVETFVNAGGQQSILDGVAELLAASLLADDIGAGDTDDAVPDTERTAIVDGSAPSFGAHAVHLRSEIHERRRALLKNYPQLVALKMASMREFEEQLSGVLQRRLAIDDPVLADDPEALRQRARLVTYVAFAGMRHAWSCWADHGGRDSLVERLHESFGELQSFVRSASR